MEGPRQRPSQGRRTAPPQVPYYPGTRGGHRDGCVGNGERRGMAELLHKPDDAPHHGNSDDSLNRAARHEVPLVAGTARAQQRTRRKGRGSTQSKRDKWDQSRLQQRFGTTARDVPTFQAPPVSTSDVRELRHLQENLPGVVADVYRAKQEGRRPSDRQQRQGCAELRLYCRRWNSLRIGPDGLLTMSLAAKHRQPAKERVICPAAIRRELIRDTHQQTHTGVQGVLTELQLRWHWPHMGRDIRCRVRQCETSQANKHGRPPGEAGRRMRNAEGPWQAETVALVENMITTPQEDVARQERPLPSLEVRPPPPALTLPRPLPESDTDPEVQNPPPGGRGFVQRH